jgi:hypothetical protein
MLKFIKIILCSVTMISCKSDMIKTKGMEFYLLEDISTLKACEDFEASKQVIKSLPLVTDNEILYYDWNKHEITLKESAFNKIKDYMEKQKMTIYPIILTINGEKMYGLWYKYSLLSRGCRSTLISETTFDPQNGKMVLGITFGQVYDRSSLGKDPRGDKRVYDYLKSTGRLVE